MNHLLETLGGILIAGVVLAYGFPDQADRIGQSALKARSSVTALLPRSSETTATSEPTFQEQSVREFRQQPARPTFTMVIERDNYGFNEPMFVESYRLPTCSH